MIPELPTNFTYWDWLVVVVYMLLTTWIGHRMAGKQSTIRDFFLGGRRLPWQAVCGSILATEISALTFIGVPGMIFAANGNMTYLQWGIGSVIARVIVGTWFVRAYYEQEIYSPYDFIGNRLGPAAKQLTSILFFVGSILGQSVRLLVTAIILQAVTRLPMAHCILAITVVAILWTLMGGMTMVIWTDVVQFCVFIFGGLLALVVLLTQIAGGWEGLVAAGQAAGKFKLIDLSTNPMLGYTLWVGIFAMPFQNLAAFGTDQLNTQRMFCCRNAKEAGKAMIWSSVSLVITLLMFIVGIGLYAFYTQNPPPEAEAALFAKDSAFVFPTWITNELPPGVSGLILAGAFAAAVSSLDSILAALAQTTLSLVRPQRQPAHEQGAEAESGREDQADLRLSRWLVLGWGGLLGAFAIGLHAIRGDVNLVDLAFGMVAYTHGPLLAILLFALTPGARSNLGLWVGATLTFLLVLWVKPDIYNVLIHFDWITKEDKAIWQPRVAFAWMFPVGVAITYAGGWIGARRQRRLNPIG